MESQKPCIYIVPSILREVKPEAYRPRMLLIGPLYHFEKPEPNSGSRYLDYAMMEDHKVMYKEAFKKRPNAIAIVQDMKTFIEKEEKNIRASYAVSTAWISSQVFVNLILHDSIFIVEFLLRTSESSPDAKTGDLIMDNLFFFNTVLDDLTLLENQLPYFYLNTLLSPITKEFLKDQTLTQVVLQLFSVSVDMIDEATEFNHFTDLFRCIYKYSLGENSELKESENLIMDMKNACKLSSVGVEFEPLDRKYSLSVSFENGCLKMSRFEADESSNITLRNVIAYEQCHDPKNAFATNYVHFLNLLIAKDEDVEILTSEGLLTNGMGRSSMVLEMVNKLSIGVKLWGTTQYKDIVEELNTHYNSHRKRLWAKLKIVYFSDLLTTTATLAAIFLLLLTLAGTVAAIIQVSASPSGTNTTPKPH